MKIRQYKENLADFITRTISMNIINGTWLELPFLGVTLTVETTAPYDETMTLKVHNGATYNVPDDFHVQTKDDRVMVTTILGRIFRITALINNIRRQIERRKNDENHDTKKGANNNKTRSSARIKAITSSITNEMRAIKKVTIPITELQEARNNQYQAANDPTTTSK